MNKRSRALVVGVLGALLAVLLWLSGHSLWRLLLALHGKH